MTNTSKSATKFSIVFSQICLVPICAIFKGLSLLLEGFLWCGGKVLDFLSWVFGPATKGVTFLKNVIAKKSQFARAKSNKRREERRLQRNTESVKNDGKNAKAKGIFLVVGKILALLVLSPFILIFLAFTLVYALIDLICSGIKTLVVKTFGIKKAVKVEKPDSSDKPEEPWKSEMRWDIYSIKQSVSNYFNKYILCFFEKSDSSKKTKAKHDTRFIALMLLFPVVQFLVFWVYVNYRSILLAFQLELDGEIIWTFHNFKRFFSEIQASNVMMTNIRNSLLFFPVSVFITLPLSFLSSYFLFKKVPLASFYRIIFYLPSIISSVAMTMLFRYIVSSTGPLSEVEKWLGITPIEFLGKPGWAMGTVLFYTVWTGLGYNMILLSSSMSRIPKELFEAAKIDGAGIATEMFSIVLPLTWGTISTLITLSIAHLFTNIGPVILLTNGQHDTNTIASYIYFQVKSASENAYAYGSAIGLVFTIVGLPIVLGGRWVLSKISDNIEL